MSSALDQMSPSPSSQNDIIASAALPNRDYSNFGVEEKAYIPDILYPATPRSILFRRENRIDAEHLTLGDWRLDTEKAQPIAQSPQSHNERSGFLASAPPTGYLSLPSTSYEHLPTCRYNSEAARSSLDRPQASVDLRTERATAVHTVVKQALRRLKQQAVQTGRKPPFHGSLDTSASQDLEELDLIPHSSHLASTQLSSPCQHTHHNHRKDLHVCRAKESQPAMEKTVHSQQREIENIQSKPPLTPAQIYENNLIENFKRLQLHSRLPAACPNEEDTVLDRYSENDKRTFRVLMQESQATDANTSPIDIPSANTSDSRLSDADLPLYSDNTPYLYSTTKTKSFGQNRSITAWKRSPSAGREYRQLSPSSCEKDRIEAARTAGIPITPSALPPFERKSPPLLSRESLASFEAKSSRARRESLAPLDRRLPDLGQTSPRYLHSRGLEKLQAFPNLGGKPTGSISSRHYTVKQPPVVQMQLLPKPVSRTELARRRLSPTVPCPQSKIKFSPVILKQVESVQNEKPLPHDIRSQKRNAPPPPPPPPPAAYSMLQSAFPTNDEPDSEIASSQDGDPSALETPVDVTLPDDWDIVDEMEVYEQDERDWKAVKDLDGDIPTC